MRNIPSIMFELDDSIEYGDHMDKLIDEVIRNDEEKHGLSSEKTDEEKQI